MADEELLPSGAAPESEPEPAPETPALSADELLGDAPQPAADTSARDLKAVLEAIVYVLNEPLPAAQIAAALDRPVAEVAPLLAALAQESLDPGRGILIREVAGGYQMSTKAEHHEVIRSFVRNLKQPLKLSQAALETLAVIAYKQPVTAPEILEIRGVQGIGVLKTLLERRLITTAGRKNVVGKPILYKTTKDFLTQFGLRDLAELPTLKEFEEIRRQSMADDLLPGEGAPEPESQQALELEPAAAAEQAAAGAPVTAVEPPAAEPAPPEPPESDG